MATTNNSNANTTEKLLKSAAIFGRHITYISGNLPTQYNDRRKQYMSERSRYFGAHRAYLATDYVEAQVQGLTDNFYDYTTAYIRLADAGTQSVTALTSKKNDDWKEIMFSDPNIEYLPIGAKIQTMGSTWLVVNPSNLSSAEPKAIIARCNASYNSYDDDGNIVTEPLVISQTQMLSNPNESPLNLVLMHGYFNVFCQKNPNTMKLGENKRIMLGDKAYKITGFTDFIQEFTGDNDSTHYITFTARVSETTKRDDLVNRIANGLEIAEEMQTEKDDTSAAPTPNTNAIEFFGLVPSAITQYDVGLYKAAYVVNGVATETPLNWSFSGADETAYQATVDEDGLSCTVVCYAYSQQPLVITATYGNYSTSITVGLESY